MPQLTSYTDLSEATNASLINQLSPVRPGGSVSLLHVGGHPSLSGARLNTGQEYPFTAMGRLGLRIASTQETLAINQFQNRFNANTGNQSAAQLILLDTADQQLIDQALRRDARHTRRDDPTADPDYQWLMQNKAAVASHLARNPFSHTVSQRLQSLRNRNQQLFNVVHAAFAYDDHGRMRYGHHEAKSATRLSGHYTNLRHGLDVSQHVTEARGEYAASKILITVLQGEYQMKMGKAANGARPNGIDQIWVRRNQSSGQIVEYLIVESKGSINAHLGHPQDGAQMSPRWLFVRLVRMAAGNASYIDNATNPRMARKILDAMFDDAQTVPVRGIVFHSLYGTTNENQVVQYTDLGTYNNPGALTAAQNNQQLFTGPPRTGVTLMELS